MAKTWFYPEHWCLKYQSLIYPNYSDLTGPHPKNGSLVREIPLFQGNRVVGEILFHLGRSMGIWVYGIYSPLFTDPWMVDFYLINVRRWIYRSLESYIDDPWICQVEFFDSEGCFYHWAWKEGVTGSQPPSENIYGRVPVFCLNEFYGVQCISYFAIFLGGKPGHPKLWLFSVPDRIHGIFTYNLVESYGKCGEIYRSSHGSYGSVHFQGARNEFSSSNQNLGWELTRWSCKAVNLGSESKVQTTRNKKHPCTWAIYNDLTRPHPKR